jgi:hypothetical protein
MERPRRCLGLLLVLTAGLSACGSLTTWGPAPQATVQPSRVATLATRVPPKFDVFSSVQDLDAQQAQAVSAVMDLLRAYDLAQVDGVLTLVASDVAWVDCDYAREAPVAVQGRSALAGWLQQRFADHDQFAVSGVIVDPLVIAISYSKRTNGTMRSRGFANGIEPKGATKVVFHLVPLEKPLDYGTGARNEIEYFSNASIGTPADCRRLNRGS